MGGSLAKGLLQTDVIKAADITVADPSSASLAQFKKSGAHLTTDNMEAAAKGDIVFVVVKPWLVRGVLEQIKPAMDYNYQTIVVIAAGVPSAEIIDWLGKGSGMVIPPLFLAIPNIAIAMHASMTFLVPINATEKQTKQMTGLFDLVGKTIITDEKHLAAGTSLASSGIAYAMRYIRAASQGGVELGFKADDAKLIVMQTMEGAVRLLETTGLHPEAAIDMVTTPGGVTIKGLIEMENAGFSSSVIRGLKAGM